jgi:hypothetical protein
MAEDVYISHEVGWCPVCGAPVFDNGQSDDPALREHDWAVSHPQQVPR